MSTWHAVKLCDIFHLSRVARQSLGHVVAVIALSALWYSLPPETVAQPLASTQVGPGTASPGQTPAQKFTVSGTAIDAVTGEPVRKALVQLNGRQRRTSFSDSDGRFQFEGVPAGSVTFMAQKPGYFGDQELMRETPAVEAGAGPVVIKLTPESVIGGKVMSSAGTPLEHVSLNLTYIDVREGRRHWESKGSAMTDEDGRYRFANLRPGGYYVSASPFTPIADSVLEGNRTPKTGYPGVYYPGVPDLASASPIQLSAGQPAEANFSLSEVPVYAVSGTISGYAVNQGVGIQVFDGSGVLVDRGVQFSPENGRFDVAGLAPGAYVLKAYSSAGPNQQTRAELRFHLEADLHNLHLALAPALSIPIVVQMESKTQSPRSQASAIRFANAGPPVSVRLLGNGPGATEAYAGFEGPQNQQSLILRNVEPGRYSAIIDAREPWYVASAESGQTNMLTDDLVVTAGTPAPPINIVLRNDGASLNGTVRVPDGTTAHVTVVAVPDGVGKASPVVGNYYPPQDKSSGTSEFSLDGLAPGEYTVFAFDHTAGIEYANRDVLQNYSSQTAHVTLSPGQRAKVTLELIRTTEAAN